MEVELRAAISDLKAMRKRLIKKGAKFNKEAKRQIDRYYRLRGEELSPQGPGSAILRIRTGKEKAKLTVKVLTDRPGIWEEHEVTVSSEEEARRILECAGFVELFTIDKRRTQGKLKEFTLCLDSLEVLGDHLEVELISDDGEAAQARIRELFRELLIPEESIETRGYARIILEQMGVTYQ